MLLAKGLDRSKLGKVSKHSSRRHSNQGTQEKPRYDLIRQTYLATSHTTQNLLAQRVAMISKPSMQEIRTAKAKQASPQHKSDTHFFTQNAVFKDIAPSRSVLINSIDNTTNETLEAHQNDSTSQHLSQIGFGQIQIKQSDH
jgi:hypothetical protein